MTAGEVKGCFRVGQAACLLDVRTLSKGGSWPMPSSHAVPQITAAHRNGWLRDWIGRKKVSLSLPKAA